MVKNPPAMQEIQVWSLGLEDPLKREWLPTPVLLPGEFHGQNSLVNYSPRGHKELGMAEQLDCSLSVVHLLGQPKESDNAFNSNLRKSEENGC